MAEKSAATPIGLLIGVGLGLLVGLLLGSVVGRLRGDAAGRDARRGWNLVPVIVMAKDTPPGVRLTFDDISQRNIPEQFFTGSMVHPDEATLVMSSQLRFALKAGDVIQKTALAPAAPSETDGGAPASTQQHAP